jgi:hypothetical protein
MPDINLRAQISDARLSVILLEHGDTGLEVVGGCSCGYQRRDSTWPTVAVHRAAVVRDAVLAVVSPALAAKDAEIEQVRSRMGARLVDAQRERDGLRAGQTVGQHWRERVRLAEAERDALRAPRWHGSKRSPASGVNMRCCAAWSLTPSTAP